MKIVMAFVIGVAVGALAALLLAPKSGEELRAELVREAQAERERLKSEYAQAIEGVHQRVDKVHGDVQVMLAQVKERGETAVADERPSGSAA